MEANNKLTRQQKEAIGILSIGTFLEYFDLMLYVHMAVILNDLFFPKTDPVMAKLLAALAFCSTFVFRPIGGFVIGKIGDKIGRKYTIMITTFIMAGTCGTMAIVGTYEEIGITATIIIIICRMLQGFSSLGEVVGALICMSEMLKQPTKYVASCVINVGSKLGTILSYLFHFLRYT